MSKSEEKRTETQKEAQIEEMVKKDALPARKFRYYCDACTGIAFYATEIVVGTRGNCEHCNKPYVSKKENYIKL